MDNPSYAALREFPEYLTVPRELLAPFLTSRVMRHNFYKVTPTRHHRRDFIVWHDGEVMKLRGVEFPVGEFVVLRKLANGAPAPHDDEPEPEVGK